MPGPVLTPDHVARVHRGIADAGPTPGVAQQIDSDYAGWVERILRDDPAPDRPIQLLAYGSLIWKPEIAHRSERPAARAAGTGPSVCE
jgi:cation transport protein ChaC